MKGEILSDWKDEWMDGEIEGTSYVVIGYVYAKNNALQVQEMICDA